jgi:oxygen-independent coproporphyrinogen-3 oxidase
MEHYHRALAAEILTYVAQQPIRQSIKTIFIGGGTPSTYPPHLLLDIFGTLKKEFDFDPSAEITLEVNPGTVTPEKVVAWKEAGINRLSIGVQSLQDTVLVGLNRHQSVHDVITTLEYTSPFFDALSIDLILGLPGVSSEVWKDTIRRVVEWPITHISIYFLTIHEQTPLYYKVETKKVQIPPDDEVMDLYLWTLDALDVANFDRYEVSNFARRVPGISYRSQHNMVYWDRKPYKGFGLGAWSFDGSIRSHNEKNLLIYCDRAMRGDLVTVFTETVTPYQVWFEQVMLSMRRAEGVSCNLLRERIDAETVSAILEELVAAHYARYDGASLILTHKGLAVENEIVVRLTAQSTKNTD